MFSKTVTLLWDGIEISVDVPCVPDTKNEALVERAIGKLEGTLGLTLTSVRGVTAEICGERFYHKLV